MTNKELAKATATWFENELMSKSEITTRITEDSEESVERDFERRSSIINFCLEIEKRVLKELNEGNEVSIQYKDEEGNMIKEIAEIFDVEGEWIPEACVTVSEEKGMSVSC